MTRSVAPCGATPHPALRATFSRTGEGARAVRDAPSTSWKRPVSAAEELSRSAARLRRRAERRVLDSSSAAEVLAATRSTARWVGKKRI
jgi:hypothetical protein